MKDYYRILDVSPDAEKNEIKASYKRLIKRYHPDTLDSSNRDDPNILQTVQELNEAYAILGNEEKRLLYDDAIQVYKNKSRPLFTANQNYEQ